MHLVILGGFLGSGKTTFLLKLAHYLADHAQTGKMTKVAIIENEIGEVGVDSSILAAGGLNTRNLFAGCACCSLRGELIEAIEEIERELDPETLIVEATGVAIPENIRRLIKERMGREVCVVVLADGSRWFRMLPVVGELARGQLEGADLVIISKIDLLSDEELETALACMRREAPESLVLPFNAMASHPDETVLAQIPEIWKERKA